MIGLSMLNAEYIRDNTKEIVIDTTTSLMWQDNNDTNSTTYTWTDAISQCEGLNHGGYTDWHLPNFNELYNLADRSKSSPALDATFNYVNISSYYWSSTTYVATPSKAWVVVFNRGNDYSDDKTLTFYVRCVR